MKKQDVDFYSDGFVLQELKNGNPKYFEVLYFKYYPVLTAYSSQFIPKHEGEDVVQEIMIKAWQNCEFLVDKTLKSYLFKSVRNNCLTLITHKELSRNVSDSILYEQYNEFDDPNSYIFNELINRLDDALNRLPDTYRQAFELNRFHNMSYKEIAEKLNVSPKTIDYRIQQALKQLRCDLKDYA